MQTVLRLERSSVRFEDQVPTVCGSVVLQVYCLLRIQQGTESAPASSVDSCYICLH